MAYILDSLPDGYAVFDRPRLNMPEIVGFFFFFLFVYDCGSGSDIYSAIGSFMVIRLDSISTPWSSSFLTFTT